MSALDDLRAVRALLASPDAWAKDSYALTEEGMSAIRFGETKPACRWCLVGAIAHVRGEAPSLAEGSLATALLADQIGSDPAAPYKAVEEFNDDDETTHDAVLALLDRAIAAEERSGEVDS